MSGAPSCYAGLLRVSGSIMALHSDIYSVLDQTLVIPPHGVPSMQS